jgi:hypothetical protein
LDLTKSNCKDGFEGEFVGCEGKDVGEDETEEEFVDCVVKGVGELVTEVADVLAIQPPPGEVPGTEPTST